MQNRIEMTAIGVRVLKNARKVSKTCSVRTRYIRKNTRLYLNCAKIALSASDRSWQNKKKRKKESKLPYAAHRGGAKSTSAWEWGSELRAGKGR